ncbi:MAG TPA: hypothetical protein VGG69_02880 [Rhizomicrobium sp.]
MRSKTIILSTAAVLAFASAVATPGYARTHHRAHHMASGSSTPAERAQTADLNRQQLQQASMTSAGTSAAGNPSLSTTPTTYQKPGSPGMSGASSGTAGSASAPTNAATAPPQDMAPAGTDTATPATPSGAATPAPADTSGGTQ